MGTDDQVGVQGDYTGANRLVLDPTTLTSVELLAFLPGGGTPHSYDVKSADGTVAAGEVFKVFATNLAAGENLSFDGSSETNGSFLFFGGAQADGFFFGPERFGRATSFTAAAVSTSSAWMDTAPR